MSEDYVEPSSDSFWEVSESLKFSLNPLTLT